MKTNLFILTLIVALNVSQAQEPDWFNDYIRRIHMDFHTPEIDHEGVIKNFDAKAYVKTLKDANVNSLVTFAKGHHGNSYYNTELGHRHKALPEGVDMLGEIIRECHANDMKVLAYYSVGWLTPVEKERSEWMERDKNGNKMGTRGVENTDFWNCICLNSPYLDTVIIPELREIAANYDMDGMWIDIIENNPCHCQWCKAKYAEENNGPYTEEVAKEFAQQTRYEAVDKMRKAVHAEKPQVQVSYNTAGRHLPLVPVVDYLSIETHPGTPLHQGAWSHGLLVMKYLQQFNKPWESTTSRFIHGWGGWDDQSFENIMAVTSRIAANGGVINLGDQTFPTGQLDTALYKKIGKVYSKIEKMEPWALKASSYPQVGLLATSFDIYSVNRTSTINNKYLGAVKVLTDRKWHFDMLMEPNIGELEKYKSIVLPNLGELRPETVTKIKNYVKNGGKVLITGNSSFSEEEQRFGLSELMGARYKRMSPYSSGYLDLSPPLSQNLRKSPLLTPGHFIEVDASDKTEVLGKHIYPIIEARPEELFFFRNTRLSPPGDVSDSPAIIKHNYGKGEVIYVAAPIFEVYWNQHQWYLKDVVDNLLKELEVERVVEVDAPDAVELFLMEKNGHLVVNLINYHLHKETNQVEDVIPLYDVELKVKKDVVEGPTVKVVGENDQYRFTEDDTHYYITLDRLDIYSQVILKLRQ